METNSESDDGRKRPTQVDVAKRAGVVPSTVSKVINGAPGISTEMRMRVLDAIRDLGYPIVEQKPVGPPTGARIKLITYYQFLVRESSYFHAEVINSVIVECERLGLHIDTVLLSRDHHNDPLEYRHRLQESEAEAAIFIGVDGPEWLGPVRESGMPAILINGNDPECTFDSVSPSVRDGSRMATRYLIELGHRDIIHVTHLYRNFIRQRLEGFREALEGAGIPFSMARNVINIDEDPTFSADKAADVICKRVQENKLDATALFCVTDYTAFGVIQGIQRAGRSVPEDYSVISFDDLPLAQLCRPPITAVGVDRETLGRAAVQRLMERIRSPHGPSFRIDVGAELTVRGSTRKLEG